MSSLSIHGVTRISLESDDDNGWATLSVSYRDHYDNLHGFRISLFYHDDTKPEMFIDDLKQEQEFMECGYCGEIALPSPDGGECEVCHREQFFYNEEK